MRFFDRIGNGWELAKQSWRVLMLDKELLAFPMISGFCCLLVTASFIVPLFLVGGFDAVISEDGLQEDATQNPLVYLVTFAFYFVNYFVIIFFNSALVACAIIRFKGGDPVISDGLNASLSRLPQIAGWALVSATVGMILKVIESRSERAGQIVAGLLGAAWSIMTYFVVPIIVVEKAGPQESFSRSFAIMRKTWGEALSANFGIGIIGFLCSLAAFLPIAIGGYLLATGVMIPGGILIACGVIGLLIVSLITAALDSIVLAALYLYAAEGKVPQYFDNSLLEHAFVHRS